MKHFENKSSPQGVLDADISIICDKVKGHIQSSENERKVCTMTHKTKIALVAICATLILGITAFAASGIVTTWYSSSSHADEFYELPEGEKLYDEIGYKVVLIDTFENGYEFNRGHVVNNRLADDGNNTVEKFKSTTFYYEKDGDRVIYSQDKFEADMPFDGDMVCSENGVDIYYNTFVNKFVPADYELTEEDKRAEESGELVFSYGTDTVEIITVQSVSFEKDGIRHSLMQMDGKLIREELVAMAKEIINK
ncbi:MAG: hypothetical protein IJ435_00385 [Clostridia bacterium]|nr:hypothetical protein [Clostridia bacterium]